MWQQTGFSTRQLMLATTQACSQPRPPIPTSITVRQHLQLIQWIPTTSVYSVPGIGPTHTRRNTSTVPSTNSTNALTHHRSFQQHTSTAKTPHQTDIWNSTSRQIIIVLYATANWAEPARPQSCTQSPLKSNLLPHAPRPHACRATHHHPCCNHPQTCFRPNSELNCPCQRS